MGKTRLALAAAAHRRACWVDLGAGERRRRAGAVCRARVRGRPDQPARPGRRLIAVLRQRPALLVLDNAEHLVNAVAVLVERLLGACAELHVLVTSRVRLAVGFERVFRVDGLSGTKGGDAVALFVERMLAAGAEPPEDADLDTIGVVCTALGGLPLAIELAAVRLPGLGLDGVVRGLLDQPALLSAGPRLSPRHRSMNGALDWSVDLLDPPVAACLRRLSVFVAPFDAEAAEGVAAFAPLQASDIPAALTELTEHNLLAAATLDGRRTYRMLEPVRQYGLARMVAGDEAALTNHLSWCRRCVARLLEDETPDAAAAGDDVRAALARAATGAVDTADAATLARSFALVLYRSGALREAQARFEQAAALDTETTQAAVDLAHASAVARCRVLGEDALRIDLAAAARAEVEGQRVASALALCRAAELLTRFPACSARGPRRSPGR